MDAPLVIDDFQRADLERVVAIASASPLLARYGHDPAVTRRDWAAADDGTGRLVARAGAEVVGLLRYLPRGAFGRSGYLKLILVDGAHSGRGVGRALIAEMERRWLVPSGIFLLCTADNDGAVRFYRALGYAEVGCVPGYVRPELDERVFYKAPPPARGA